MTQYQRITGKVFGGNATATGNDPQIAQFGSALANTFVGTTDPETIQSLPAWGQGWIGAVTPETQFPPLPEMTGAMKVLSHQICGILQQGVSTWDSGTIYYTGNFCSKNGIVYVSLSDLNQGNDPETDNTNWRNYGGADIDLSNLSSQGKNIANWSTNVTNCLTEIPQNIKLDLTDGVLTLKAGSKVIVPNGFEADGTTPKFDYVTIESDYNYDGSTVATNEQIMMVYNTELKAIQSSKVTTCYSGDTAPQTTQTGAFWYDTANNIVKRLGNSQWNTAGYSLSIAVATNGTVTGGSFTSLDQVFNGMGYIGSTIWVDKGVKVLIPNGRNEDGSLKNIELVTTNVKIRTVTYAYDEYFVIRPDGSLAELDKIDCFIQEETPKITQGKWQRWFNIRENYWYYHDNTQTTWINAETSVHKFAIISSNIRGTNGAITSFQPKQPFRAIDYSDKSEVSGWAMPSDRYINLTLGASNTTYTAPANGWFYLIKAVSAGGQYIQLRSLTTGITCKDISVGSTDILCIFLPAKSGEVLYANYSAQGATNYFRFIYAEGEV